MSVYSWGVSLYDVTSYLAAWSHVPSGGLSPWSHVPSGVSVKGVSVQGIPVWGSLSGGISVQGSLCLGGVSVGRLLESEKRVVRILLECFLVSSVLIRHGKNVIGWWGKIRLFRKLD